MDGSETRTDGRTIGNHGLSMFKRMSNTPSQSLLLPALFLSGFLIIAASRSSFAQVDSHVNSWSTSIQTSLLTMIAEAISLAFDAKTLLALSLLASAYLLYKSLLTEAILLLSAMGANALCVETAKMLIQSPRPLNGLMEETGYSFPSGHASATIVYLGLLAYFAHPHLNNPKAKTVSNAAFTTAAALVGFNRIYLNSHWLSDVIGGYMLGAFWTTLTMLTIRHLKAREKNHRRAQDSRNCTISPYSHHG